MQSEKALLYDETTTLTPKLIEGFQWAFKSLKTAVNSKKIDELAKLVNTAMESRTRTFHTPNHVFDISNDGTPIEVLAALFHDLVYFNVDEEFPEQIWKRLSPYVVPDGEGLKLKFETFSQNRCAQFVLELFGIEKGNITSVLGLNEFLSALMAATSYEKILTEIQIVSVIACIEATIPFRTTNSEGETPSECMARKLATMNKKYIWGMSQEQIDKIVQVAIHLGNKDIENFAIDDPTAFLDNTWKLMPESNPALRNPELYTIRDYRIALEGMERFLSKLDPTSVFHHYKEYPDPQQLSEWTRITTKNIQTTLSYVRSKYVCNCILEAMAELTGGIVPMSYFMGNLKSRDSSTGTIQKHLPQKSEWKISDDVVPVVFQILHEGRKSNIWFDARRSAISAYLYAHIGNAGITSAMLNCKNFTTQKIAAEKFLSTFPKHLIHQIALSCSETAKTRGNQLKKLAADFQG